MSVELKRYRNRIIIMTVIVIIALILGIITTNITRQYYGQVQNLIEVIQSSSEEEYNNRIAERAANEGKDISEYATKEQALQIANDMAKPYEAIFKYSNLTVVIMFTLSISGPFIGLMMYFIFTGWLINKIWKDIKKWLSVLMRILALVILGYVVTYPLIAIGVFGQIPFIIYTVYKFIRTKKSEEKDDVIKTK